MRSLARRRLQLFRTGNLALISAARPSRKRDQSIRPPTTRVLPKRTLTSTTTSSSAPPPSLPPDSPPDDPSLLPPDSEPPKSKTPKSKPDPERVDLPEDLDILWTPQGIDPSNLPPPEVFQEALNSLHITLHPHTQHRAVYPSVHGQPIEPTLGLYCPIEGGDYIIDATVGELAVRTGAEVLVLDAVQLAAGEWGSFGKAANSLQLSENPLHFASPLSHSGSSMSQAEEDDDEEDSMPDFVPRHLALTVMSGRGMPGILRSSVSSPSKRPKPPSEVRVFFDTLVDLPSKPDTASSSTRSVKNKPRLIYVRDFPTLAPSSASWYPHLLAAVRQRRKGAMTRSSAPVSNPMTIIFGMSPSLTPPASLPSSSHPGSGLMNLLMNRSSPPAQVFAGSKATRADWSEGESAENSRDRRLRDRLKKWEVGDSSLYDELPALSANGDEQEAGQKPEMIILGLNNLPVASRGKSDEDSSSSGSGSSFFRTSVLVPSQRSLPKERESREARRREINELTMRMAIGAIGGVLESTHAATNLPSTTPEDLENPENAPQPSNHQKMWEDWARKVEVWSNVRQIADHAVGTVVSERLANGETGKATMEPTFVPWSAVHDRWAALHTARDRRKSWMKEVLPPSKTRTSEEEEATEAAVEGSIDELVERLKNDSELDAHEQRLLPTIVDRASMPTSFSQVHLPEHTIDSVRTIVSLPLLYPQAFQEGILKEHGMTGCLLFGPPGTGKTLVVRALAREAGCRMMVVSPSDVMDMYVGEGEKLVRAVFSLARRLSPCVIFIDEIDALFGARMSARESGGAFAHRSVITEFMQEMDGLKTSKDDQVIVIGATNRPFDLDDAVLRRLPRRLLVDLPGLKERAEILKILLRNESLGDDVDITELAKKTESFSGSDLKHLCVSAALDAVKEHVRLPWKTSSSLESITGPSVKSLTSDVELTGLQEDSAAPQSTESSSDECSTSTSTSDEPALTEDALSEGLMRVLSQRNFLKALKEITPSSSEALGTLAELRKWNNEFGEGSKDHKRRQAWGRDRFGFADGEPIEEGRVLPIRQSTSPLGSS